MVLRGRVWLEAAGLSAEALFTLVADVEGYPAFLPWCRGVRVLADDGAGTRVVENRFGAGPFEARFVSRATAEPPRRLTIASSDGPFRALALEWRFTDGQASGEYSMTLRSPLLHGLARMALPEMERRVVARFQRRAAALGGR